MDDPIQTPTPAAQPTPVTEQPKSTEPAPAQIEPAAAPVTNPTPEPKTEPQAGGLLGDSVEPKEGEKGDEGKETQESTVLGAPEDGYNKEKMGEADPEISQAFMDVAKELNLSQESVDKLYEKVAPVMRQRADAMMAQAEKDWTQQSLVDPEFGGNNFGKNQLQIKKAFAKYASPELKKVLRDSRLDCHPEVLRLFYRISKDISEDVLLKGSGGTERTGRANDPREMFPMTKMNL